jgi:hypothetical protein
VNENPPQEQAVRQGRPFRIGCLVLFLLALISCGGWLWWSSQRGWTVAKLERLIQAEVPQGCDRTTVEAWFNHHGICYDWFEDTTGDMRGRSTMPQLVGLRSENLSGMLRGVIEGPEANVDLIAPGKISVYFFFDKQGRRVGHLVAPFAYMP